MLIVKAYDARKIKNATKREEAIQNTIAKRAKKGYACIGHDGHEVWFMKRSKLKPCCSRCQVFTTCETKWLRGEKGEISLCCVACRYFTECYPKEKRTKKIKRHM
ncbi:MAG: hypothetical protein AB1393_04760 [Candidatus Edwardsbacteria bacterium]